MEALANDGQRGERAGRSRIRARMVVGADIGGTKICTVLAGDDRRVTYRTWAEHDVGATGELVDHLVTAVEDCREVARGYGGEVVAVGVSVAGWLSPDRERLIVGANLGARDRDLGGELRRRLGLPVVIENDGNTSALAEARAAKESRCLVVLTLGTGVGGGVVIDGQPLLGGCLELFASGPAIARAGHAATSAEVVDAAEAGDATAQRVLRAAGSAIGRAVVLLVPVVDPDLVIISGRLADAAARYLLPAARATVNRARPLRQVTAPPRIDLGRVGPEAAAIGAAELALLIPAGVASSAAGPRSA